MTNVFCITYGGRAKNGNIYVPYKAIAHTAEEAIAVINTWKSYGRKNFTESITVNERTAEKIHTLFRDGLGSSTRETMRTTGCGAWDIAFYPALADTLEEHERIYNARREAAKAERMRQAEKAKERRLAELNEQKRGWYHVELDLELMVFADVGNDYIAGSTFEGDVIADSGMDAYQNAVKHVQDHPEELTHCGNMAVLQFWAEPYSSGYDFSFLGVKTDDGYSLEKWEEWKTKGEMKSKRKENSEKGKAPWVGHTYLYAASPVYGHRDYNKGRMLKIEGNERTCEILARKYAPETFLNKSENKAMATKKSLYDIAQMWNEWNEAEQEPDMELLERTITENGYVSDCHEQWGICHSDTEEVRLMDDLTAMVFDRKV